MKRFMSILTSTFAVCLALVLIAGTSLTAHAEDVSGGDSGSSSESSSGSSSSVKALPIKGIKLTGTTVTWKDPALSVSKGGYFTINVRYLGEATTWKSGEGTVTGTFRTDREVTECDISSALSESGNYWIFIYLLHTENIQSDDSTTYSVNAYTIRYYDAGTDEADEDDEDTDSVESSEGAIVENKVAVSGAAPVAVAVVTEQSTLNTFASLPADQYAEVKMENGVSDNARNLIDSVADARGVKVASAMEIYIQATTSNGAPAGTVSEFSAPIEFTVQVPSDINENDYDFAMIRIHDGKADILPDIDDDPKTITFRTDKFSAYAIVYGEKGSFGNVKNSAGAKNLSSPKTYDNTYALFSLAMVFTVLTAVSYVFCKKTEK